MVAAAARDANTSTPPAAAADTASAAADTTSASALTGLMLAAALACAPSALAASEPSQGLHHSWTLSAQLEPSQRWLLP